MKFVKAIVAIMLAVIFAFVTRYYMSNLNLQAVGEFTPIPHFFPSVDMSYKFSLALMFAIYLFIFGSLVSGKYFRALLPLAGMIVGLMKYKAVTETFATRNMTFVPALLEFGKLLCVFTIIGIVIQWFVDGGLAAIRLVNKNKK